jgi:hypothetical protein
MNKKSPSSWNEEEANPKNRVTNSLVDGFIQVLQSVRHNFPAGYLTAGKFGMP